MSQETTERLRSLIAEAAEAAVYMTVDRYNHAGYRMAGGMVATIPIPLWEQIVEAIDQHVEAEERETHALHPGGDA